MCIFSLYMHTSPSVSCLVPQNPGEVCIIFEFMHTSQVKSDISRCFANTIEVDCHACFLRPCDRRGSTVLKTPQEKLNTKARATPQHSDAQGLPGLCRQSGGRSGRRLRCRDGRSGRRGPLSGASCMVPILPIRRALERNRQQFWRK